MAFSTTSRDDQYSDYDNSSCSSMTPADSSYRSSWISNLSSGSRSPFSTSHMIKPHKANQAAWEAMSRLRRQNGGKVGLEHLRLLRQVGTGDIGNVYLCQIRNPAVGSPPCLYAMKVVNREALALRKKLGRAEAERQILGLLDHPFLPTLYAEFEASHYSCLVMEFCPGGDLFAARLQQPTKRYSISSVRFYAAETLLALEYLHMMGIVYRDLKPENVLLREDGHIMLSDFDLSLKCDVALKLLKQRLPTIDHNDSAKSSICTTPCATPIKLLFSCLPSRIMRKKIRTTRNSTIATSTTNIHAIQDSNGHDDDDHDQGDPISHHHDQEFYGTELVAEPINARSKSFVGTHEYLAPEVISGQGHGSEVDWWTLGVFMHELLYGRTPFKGENNERTLINILKQPVAFPRIRVTSAREHEEMEKAQDLMRKLLAKDPEKRIGSTKGSVEIKRHEFFKGVNWALIRSARPPEVPGEVNTKIVGYSNDKKNNNNRSMWTKPLSKTERDEPYQIPNHFDYF